jgi:hypothetical protein
VPISSFDRQVLELRASIGLAVTTAVEGVQPGWYQPIVCLQLLPSYILGTLEFTIVRHLRVVLCNTEELMVLFQTGKTASGKTIDLVEWEWTEADQARAPQNIMFELCIDTLMNVPEPLANVYLFLSNMQGKAV